MEGEDRTQTGFQSTTCIRMQDLTAESVEKKRIEFKNLLSNGVNVLELDFIDVHRVDSTGIGLLIQAHNSLQQRGGALRITHANPEVIELFQCMRLDTRFQMDV